MAEVEVPLTLTSIKTQMVTEKIPEEEPEPQVLKY